MVVTKYMCSRTHVRWRADSAPANSNSIVNIACVAAVVYLLMTSKAKLSAARSAWQC